MVLLQPATGVSFILSYGVYFFLIAGSTEPFQDAMIVNCIGILGVFLSMYTMKVARRRPILMISFVALGIVPPKSADLLALCMFSIALAYTVAPTSNSAAKCVVAFLVIYQFFYNWGISPYTFLIGGEIPAQRTLLECL